MHNTDEDHGATLPWAVLVPADAALLAALRKINVRPQSDVALVDAALRTYLRQRDNIRQRQLTSENKDKERERYMANREQIIQQQIEYQRKRKGKRSDGA